MRDFRDAKAMARALRDALKVKRIEITHAEALELIAKEFGYENWNVLSAKIEAKPHASSEGTIAAGTQNDEAPPKTLYCSFCGKSQHEVHKLIAGPGVFICDECTDLCTEIVEPDEDKELFRLATGNEGSGERTLLERARGMSTQELAYYLERGRKGLARSRVALEYFQHRLAKWDCEGSVSNDIRMPSLPRHLVPPAPMDMTRENLVEMQQKAQNEAKRYEDALIAAATALGERRQ
jgi:hypothetical protein